MEEATRSGQGPVESVEPSKKKKKSKKPFIRRLLIHDY
jgi:hypothetical protein